ncbi:MAG: Spi family protease inhibitor [Muribaculaceae bacterium]|nr:Spi family protease inhibitor [Muribaculaceae bacterium]
MKKFIAIIVAACIGGLSSVHAETVSRKEANALAQKFFNTAYGEVTAPPQMVWNGRQLTTDRLFSPIYVYNSPKEGYVIISGENKAFPILAYSTKRKFEREKLTEAELKYLEKYAKEIELIRYDPRMPVSAIDAWQNINDYIVKVLETPYNTQEYKGISEARQEELEMIDRTGNQIFMPSAIEFHYYDPEDYRDLTLDDIAVEEDDDEIPFSFYENFIKEIKREEQERDINFEELIAPTRPVINVIGGGHFEITYPESIKMMRVYALNGMQMLEKYYKDTQVMNLDMEGVASGFYVGLSLSDSGKVYGFKLYR